MSEQRFEYRVQKILEKKGFLVINVRMPFKGGQSYDLIAIKDGMAFPIEVKGLKIQRKKGKIYKYLAPYLDEQREKQMKLSSDSGTGFFLIRQSTIRGKMIMTAFDPIRLEWFSPSFGLIYNALEEYLE